MTLRGSFVWLDTGDAVQVLDVTPQGLTVDGPGGLRFGVDPATIDTDRTVREQALEAAARLLADAHRRMLRDFARSERVQD